MECCDVLFVVLLLQQKWYAIVIKPCFNSQQEQDKEISCINLVGEKQICLCKKKDSVYLCMNRVFIGCVFCVVQTDSTCQVSLHNFRCELALHK